MRITACLVVALLISSNATAQPAGGAAWTISEFGIGFTLPAGWTADPPGSDGIYGITKSSKRPGNPADAFCIVSELKSGAREPGEAEITQDKINRGTEPLPLDVWIKVMARLGVDHLTWLETRPTFIVDGKAAVSARGATDGKPIRRIVHMAQVMTPEFIYPVTCMYYTGLPPFKETAQYRASTLAEFETLLRTFHVTAR